MLVLRKVVWQSIWKLTGCALILLSGEFGVVYKANLQWHLDAATEVVAVKTLKGIPFGHHFY